jgi:hypothetical protein
VITVECIGWPLSVAGLQRLVKTTDHRYYRPIGKITSTWMAPPIQFLTKGYIRRTSQLHGIIGIAAKKYRDGKE